MSDIIGSITHLFVKPKHGVKMLECKEIHMKVGSGIDGDINSNAISPRQVLLVRYEDLETLSIPCGELRENIVLSGIDAKDFSPGAVLKTNSGAAVRLTFYCEPCKRIAHLVDSIKSIEGKRGILGVILGNTTLKVGDQAYIQPNIFPALSEIPYERFLDFISKIPVGKVVTYKQIVIGIGVTEGYFRAIPKYLQKASVSGYPVHRVLDSEGNLTPHVKDQKEKLEAENIHVISESGLFAEMNKSYVSVKQYLWEDSTIYLI
jgi:alkylated DNA nucleotide flippase Atl1